MANVQGVDGTALEVFVTDRDKKEGMIKERKIHLFLGVKIEEGEKKCLKERKRERKREREGEREEEREKERGSVRGKERKIDRKIR